jgi:hypothetical protein
MKLSFEAYKIRREQITCTYYINEKILLIRSHTLAWLYHAYPYHFILIE